MSFRRRTYPEVRDNLLTSLSQGIAGESHAFPPSAKGPYQHVLERSAVARIVSVYGMRGGEPLAFTQDVDFRLLADGKTIEWLEGGATPDEGTLLDVNYQVSGVTGRPPDLHTGSVVRTLAEAMGLEIARLYAQLDAVYRAGFIDTADGSALDNVVALLGIDRVRGGRAAGEAKFTRSSASTGQITIPVGTRIITIDGAIEYETTEAAALSPGQTTARIPIRDTEPNDPVEADTLTVLPIPIAGIASVTNPSATAISTRDETDGELRARAKSFLHASERATLGAIRAAISRQGAAADVEELAGTPGVVRVTLHADAGLTPEMHQRVLRAVDDARPAGIVIDWASPIVPRAVNVSLRLSTSADLTSDQLRGIQQKVRAGIEDYFARLPAREAASLGKLLALALNAQGVEDAKIIAATWITEVGEEDVLDAAAGVLAIEGHPTVLGELHIADPNLATRMTAVVRFPAVEAPPNEPAIRDALTSALASINQANAGDSGAGVHIRTLSRARLMFITPLPTAGKVTGTLATFDAGAQSGAAPSYGDAGAYDVEFAISTETGLVRLLSQDEDPAYVLAPGERIVLQGVEIQEQ